MLWMLLTNYVFIIDFIFNFKRVLFFEDDNETS